MIVIDLKNVSEVTINPFNSILYFSSNIFGIRLPPTYPISLIMKMTKVSIAKRISHNIN